MRLDEVSDGRFLDLDGNAWSPFMRHHPALCRGCKQYTRQGYYRDNPAEYTVRCPSCVTVGYGIGDASHGDLAAIVNDRLTQESPATMPADVRRIVAQVADMLDAGYLHSDHVRASTVRSSLAVAV